MLTAGARPRLVPMGHDEVHERQGHRCYLCGDPFAGSRGRTATHCAPTAATRDHVFPKARRGGGEANILLAHQLCNARKGDRWPYPCEVIFLAAVYAAPIRRRAA